MTVLFASTLVKVLVLPLVNFGGTSSCVCDSHVPPNLSPSDGSQLP